MTVTYTLKVSNANLCGFAKLLARWRGSIYKLLYREMFIFIILYYGLSSIYRYTLNDEQKRVFEKIALYCDAFTDLIPLSFVLGFYVSIVVGRWWQQFMSIPWPDRVAILIASHIHGSDDKGRIIRRTLARYLNLMMAITLQGVSIPVKKRFPTLGHIVEAGLMTPEERQVYEETPSSHGKWWFPAVWFSNLAVRARKEGRIKDDVLLRQLLHEMLEFRGNCGMLFNYDWISIPLVYTQVVTIALYTFFLATVMGRQYLNPAMGYKGHDVDLYIPVFTMLQFFFYMGWLKVAEQLINPFGEDDDDFELNWCLDRGIQVALLIVDEMHMKHPKLVKDFYWDDIDPQLPYTRSSLGSKTEPYLGSTADLCINPQDATFVPMGTIMEEEGSGLLGSYSSVPPTPTPTREYLAPEFSLGSKRGSINSLYSIKRSFMDLRLPFSRKNSAAEFANHAGDKVVLELANGKLMNVTNGDNGLVMIPVPQRRNSNSGLTLPLRSGHTGSPTLGHSQHSVDESSEFLTTPTGSLRSLRLMKKPSDPLSASHSRDTDEQKRFHISDVYEPQFDMMIEDVQPPVIVAPVVPSVAIAADLEQRRASCLLQEVIVSAPMEGSIPGERISRLLSNPNDSLPPLVEVPEVDSNQSTVNSMADLIRQTKC